MNKTIKLLEEFLSTYEVEGVCHLWLGVAPDDNGIPWVYMKLDEDWIEGYNSDFIVKRMKQGVKDEIKKYLDIDVQILATTGKCEELSNLNEQLSSTIRRRISFDRLKEDLDNIIDYEINVCGFDSIGEFIAEACDWLVNVTLDNLQENPGYNIFPKDKDSLYHYCVDTFGKYLENYHRNQCVKGNWNESILDWELWSKINGKKNTIIVTESQYKRLFEQKKSKLEVFQELIDNKLNYIRGFCDNSLSSEEYSGDVGFGSCDVVDTIDSIKVDEVNMMTGARTDMEGNKYDSTPSIYVKLTINFSNIKEYVDFDDMVYDLKHILRKSTGGLPIVLDYRINNLNTNREW